MKLIFCPDCQDIVKLKREKTFCACGKCWGYYKEDGLHAIINKEAIPLGFNNFHLALRNRPEEGLGYVFGAFVIPKKCPTIRVEE